MIALQYRLLLVVMLSGIVTAFATAQEKTPPSKPIDKKDQLVLNVETILSVGSFMRDGKSLVTIGNDNILRIWDTGNATQRGGTKLGTPNSLYHWQILELPDAKRILLAGTSGKGFIFNIEDGKLLLEFPLPVENYPNSYALVDQGKTLLRLDRTLSFAKFEVETGKRIEKAEVPPPPTNPNLPLSVQLTLAPDGKTYVLHNGPCVLFDSATHKPLFTLQETNPTKYRYNNGRYPAIYTPDSKRVVLHSTDGTLHVIDVESGKEIRRLALEKVSQNLNNYPQAMIALAISPNGKWLLTGTEAVSAELVLYGLNSGLEVRRFPAKVLSSVHKGFEFSHDNKFLLFPGRVFSKAEIWDLEKGEIKLRNAPPK